MIKRLYFFAALLLFLACDKKACKNIVGPASANHRKILFIGMDGVRTDAFIKAATPNFDTLASRGIRCWNVDRGPYTVSVPGWSTILHGVFPVKHGLTENSFSGNNYSKYPDIFTIVSKLHPDWQLFSLTNWDDFMKITAHETFCQSFSEDEMVAVKAVDVLKNDNPDILLLHFDGPDAAGHSTGFSPDNPYYINAIEHIDVFTRNILAAVHDREERLGEEWMVVVCTDHGGEGTNHGGQDSLPQTRFVFFIVSGKGIPAFEKTTPTSNTDLLPTMLKYIGLPVDSTYGLDGVSLY